MMTTTMLGRIQNTFVGTHNHLQLVQLNIVQVDLCPDLAVPVRGETMEND